MSVYVKRLVAVPKKVLSNLVDLLKNKRKNQKRLDSCVLLHLMKQNIENINNLFMDYLF